MLGVFGLGPTELVVVALLVLVPLAGGVAGVVLLVVWLGKRSPPNQNAELVAALQAENSRLREQLQRLQPPDPNQGAR